MTGILTFIFGTLLAIILSPYYGATLENDWAGNIYAYRPYWVVPRSDGDAVRWFYEGVTQGTIYSPRCLDRAALLVAELDPDGVLCLLLSGGDLSPAVGRKRATGLSAEKEMWRYGVGRC